MPLMPFDNQSEITVMRNTSIKTVIPSNLEDHRVSSVTMGNIPAPSEAEQYTDSLQGEHAGRKTVQYESL